MLGGGARVTVELWRRRRWAVLMGGGLLKNHLVEYRARFGKMRQATEEKRLVAGRRRCSGYILEKNMSTCK